MRGDGCRKLEELDRYPIRSSPPPRAPLDDTFVEARLILEHCDVLQQMPIRIAKVDRGRRHPGEHYGLVSWFPIKIKRRDANRVELPRCGDDILEGCRKGDVSGRLLRTDIDFPQSQHRLAARTDPEKRRPTCRYDVGQ